MDWNLVEKTGGDLGPNMVRSRFLFNFSDSPPPERKISSYYLR
jgi:hypothetical protein